MKIFISYSHDDRAVAEEIELRLTGEGHDVFFDKDDLPAGEEFDAAIAKAISDCDLFIFLLSPTSVAEGKYTLTELELTKKRWKHGGGHVLPVLIDPEKKLDWARIPKYLSAVSFLVPQGNIPAEVSDVVRGWRWRTFARAVNEALLVWCFAFAYLVAMWLWPGRGTPIVVSVVAALTVLGTYRLRHLRDWNVTQKVLVPAAVAMTIAFVGFWAFSRTSIVRLVPSMVLLSRLPNRQVSDTSTYRMLVDGDTVLPQLFAEGVVAGVDQARWRSLANADTDSAFSDSVRARLGREGVTGQLRQELGQDALDGYVRTLVEHQYVPSRFRWPGNDTLSIDVESTDPGLDASLEARVQLPLQVSRGDCEPFEPRGLVRIYVRDAVLCFVPNDAWPARPPAED